MTFVGRYILHSHFVLAFVLK